MSLEQLGKRAGRMLANKMLGMLATVQKVEYIPLNRSLMLGRFLHLCLLEYLDEKSKAPAQPAKQWFPSQTPDHKANVASQYPGNVVPNHLQPQQ
jgi:hypothetical protein